MEPKGVVVVEAFFISRQQKRADGGLRYSTLLVLTLSVCLSDCLSVPDGPPGDGDSALSDLQESRGLVQGRAAAPWGPGPHRGQRCVGKSVGGAGLGWVRLG